MSRKTARAAATAASFSGAAVDEKENAAMRAKATILWDAFVDIGAAGKHYEDFAALNPASKAGFKAMLLAGFAEMPLATLRGACCALRRWREWAAQAEADWWAPSAVHVALWLRSLRPRGPTAAHGALANLAWLEARIGLRASTDTLLVKQQGSVAGGHVPVQAVLLRARVWAHFEGLLTSTCPYVRAVALAWLLCTAGAMRFAHLQRSTVLRMTPVGVFLRAARGKARTKGVRSPLEWTLPRLGLTGVDYGTHLDRHLALVGSGRGYIVPDIGPRNLGLAGASFFQDYAMPLPKLMSLTCSLLQAPPISLSAAQVSDITSYSCRRTLPSLADRAGFGTTERILLGGWSGAGEGAGDLTKEAKRLAMPMLYSDLKMVMQLRVKHELLEGVRLAVAGLSQSKGSAAALDPDWEELEAFWPLREVSKASTDAVFLASTTQVKRGLASSSTPIAAAAPATPFMSAAPFTPGPAQAHSGSSSRSSSSQSSSSSVSSSSGSSSASGLPTELSMQVPWILSRGARSHLHLRAEGGNRGRGCGRNFKRAEAGVGLNEALATGRKWCSRCFAALPDEARTALAAAARPAD